MKNFLFIFLLMLVVFAFIRPEPVKVRVAAQSIGYKKACWYNNKPQLIGCRPLQVVRVI